MRHNKENAIDVAVMMYERFRVGGQAREALYAERMAMMLWMILEPSLETHYASDENKNLQATNIDDGWDNSKTKW